jgi:hypothetical protein
MTDSSSVGGPGGVGNYKGVMLCNRPFAGSQAAAKAASKPATFACGRVPDAPGIGVPAESRKKVKRPKKETVLTKHRRWLAELQKTKDKLEAKYVDDMVRKEQRKENFQSQEKIMRIMSKDLLHNNVEGAKDGKSAEPPSPGVEEKKVADASPVSDSKAIVPPLSKKLNKPAWAMTEDKAADEAEGKEEDVLLGTGDDDEGLLDFANNLDFNAVIEDIEVKSLMKKLKEKINALEKDVKNEDDRELELELGAKEREIMNAIRARDMGEEGDEDPYSVDDVGDLAGLVLEEHSEIGAVQSKASVTSLLHKAKEKIADIQSQTRGGDAKDSGSECVISGEPPIVVHEPSDGERVGGKNAVSNLPYIRRNPAAV